MKGHICLIQPPFAQLNSPYPSVYYLRAFLERRGYTVSVQDHSIGLFEIIFCREGLRRIFEDSRRTSAVKNVRTANLNTQLEAVIERFLSEEDRWLSSIDRLVAFLRGRDREWGHLISLANGTLPGGPRFDACLEKLCDTKGEASPDDASLLASKLLADIADFITVTLDPGFSLIRYVPSPSSFLSADFHDFSAVEAALDGYIIKHFYRPWLKEEWKNISQKIESSRAGNGNSPFSLGITIPFPGCLAGAMACAESAKGYFGSTVITIAGGGYVNTELRFIEEERFFDYFDYVSFDRGYGSLDAILKREIDQRKAGSPPGETVPLYKTMYRDKSGIIIRDVSIAETGGAQGKRLDDDAVQSVFPDYSGVDFSRYIRPVDNANPMHRLWSDGRWLKAYAAHGCYWHDCAFCDVSLEYIRCYKPVDVKALFRHLTVQAKVAGVRGVHLVDEACPPASLLRLALLNRDAGLPLVFWGNIRFEKQFTPDAAALLAAGGLIGVSAGIEIASERGFKRVGKGIGLGDVVEASAAFKEAGILVHAYLIYGYWDEDEGEIIDSAETLRQLFAEGLLDSGFWHKFVLTKHSRIYAEKLAGMHPGLKPEGDPFQAGLAGNRKKIFSLNDLSFAGEKRLDRWTGPLDRLLNSWMRGDTSSPIKAAFPFKVPDPSIPPDLIRGLLYSYARKRDRIRSLVPSPKNQWPDKAAASGPILFLGSRPIIHLTNNGVELRWRWRLEDCALRIKTKPGDTKAEKTAGLLEAAAKNSGIHAGEFFNALEAILGINAGQAWKKLRRQGLII